MPYKTKRKAYTLVELVVVITVIAILAAASIAVGSKQIAKSRIEEATSFMQILDNDLEDGIINNTGFLDLSGYDFTQTSDSTLPDDIRTDAEAFLRELEDIYLNCSFDYNSASLQKISANGFVGFRIQLIDPVDSWNMRYSLFYLYEASADQYVIVICSAGPNNSFADGYATGYTAFIKNSGTMTTQVDDDLIDVMISR